MKLYTKEQVRIAIQQARVYEDYWHMEYQYTDNDIIKELTAIELPTDEEIKHKINKEVFVNWFSNDEYERGFQDGAKWVIQQIKKHKP